MINEEPTYDAVVVGSGPGGSVAFSSLVNEGLRVLLIEEGPDPSASESSGSIFEGIQRYYRSGGLRPILSNVGIIPFGEGRVLGGGSQVNGGLFWKTPPSVLAEWNEKGSLIDSDAISSNIEYFERKLNVGEESDLRGFDRDSDLFAEGAEKIGLHSFVARRATLGCARSNRCAIGCPSGAKRTMGKTLIPEAVADGGEVWVDSRAVRFRVDRSNRVVCTVVRGGGQPEIVRSRSLYLAAGALETPALLTRSSLLGIASFPLGIHLNAKVMARFPETVSADKATLFTRQVQDLDGQRTLLMPTAHGEEYIGMSAASFSRPLISKILRENKQYASFTAQVAPKNFGRQFFFFGLSARFYWVDTATLRILRNSLHTMARILFNAGAEEVILPIKKGVEVHSLAEVSSVVEKLRPRDLMLTSVHAMSSIPLPSSGAWRRSRITSNGQLKNAPNVLVCCSSVLPSHTIESPQATIMGVAKWIVEESLD